jgi:nitrogen fixation/metabolism regulation signal transduction histidine kinase
MSYYREPGEAGATAARIMTNRRVAVLLLLTILVGTTLPLVAAFYFLDRALETSLNLAFNPQIVEALDDASRNLRRLRDLDSASRDAYRAQFDRVEELRQIYSNPELVKSNVQGSLKTYFTIGVAGAVLLAVVMAAILSRGIARSYGAAFQELTAQRERVTYLEGMASWQELARMLAHEIRNPLTPIEVLVTSLKQAHRNQPPEQFAAQLERTEAMVGEELRHLQNTVVKFSEFAKLPQIQLAAEDLAKRLAHDTQTISSAFPALRYRIDGPASLPALLDATLFRQVLANMVRNGIEANTGRTVSFVFRLRESGNTITLEIENDGVPVSPDIAPRIFDPYVSSRRSEDNVGLGLAISRKVIIEHGGDIRYEERDGKPVFVIALPAVRA